MIFSAKVVKIVFEGRWTIVLGVIFFISPLLYAYKQYLLLKSCAENDCIILIYKVYYKVLSVHFNKRRFVQEVLN